MKPEIKYAVFDKNESVLESILKDLISLAVLSLMVYVSQDSRWWTLVTGLLFILIVFGRMAACVKKRCKTFHTKEELAAWVETL